MAFTKIAAAGIGSVGTVTLETLVVTGSINAPVITGAASTENVRTNSLVVSGVGTFASLSVTGNVSIAGTVTYDDVTNVDSIGLVTARSGVRVDAGGLVVTAGVSTLGVTTVTNLTAQSINVSGISTTGILNVGVGGTVITTTTGGLVGIGTINPAYKLDVNATSSLVRFTGAGTTIRIEADSDVPRILFETNGQQKLAIGHRGSSASGNVNYTEIRTVTADPLLLFTNNTERVRITGIGSVGIGTTNPADTLDIFGNITVGDNTVTVTSISRRNTNSGLLLGNGGSLAGTSNTTGANIELFGSTHANVPGRAFYDALNHTFRSIENIPTTYATISTDTSQFNNVVQIGSATSTGTASQPLQVTGGAYVSGILGIGITNPNSNSVLDVNGSQWIVKNAIYNNESNPGLYIRGNRSNGTVGLLLGADNTTGIAYIQPLQAGTTYAQNMSISAMGGNVGIGLTNPTEKLTVSGNINLNSSGNYIQKTFADNTEEYVLRGSSLAVWNPFVTYTRSTGTSQRGFKFGSFDNSGNRNDWMSIWNGSVGIGTTNPSTIFHIHQPADFNGITITHATRVGRWRLEHSGTSSQNFVFIQNNGTSDAVSYVLGRDMHEWYTGNTARMSMNNLGYVGINSSSPGKILDVVGSSRFISDSSAPADTSSPSCYISSGNSNDSVALEVSQGRFDRDVVRIKTNQAFSASLLNITEDNTIRFLVNGINRSSDAGNAVFYTGSAFDSSHYMVLQNNTDSYGRVGLVIRGKTFNGANNPSANDGWSLGSARSTIRFDAYLTGDTGYDTKFSIQHLMASSSNAAVGDLGFHAKGFSTTSPAVVLTAAGNLGVGLASPSVKVHISDSVSSTGATGTEVLRIANTRLNTGSGAVALRFVNNEISGTNQYTRAQIAAEYDGNSNVNGRLMFATTDASGTLQERVRIDGAGTLQNKVGTPAGYHSIRRNWTVTFQSNIDNPTVNILTVTNGNQNNSVAIKVRVIQLEFVGAGQGVGNEHIGMASIWYSGSAYSTYVNVMTRTTNLGTTNVGTLSWSGTTLRYTANRSSNYDSYYVEVEAVQNNGGGYTLTLP